MRSVRLAVLGSLLLFAVGWGGCAPAPDSEPALADMGASPRPPGPPGALELRAVVPALGPSSGGVTLSIDGQGFVVGTTVRIADAEAAQVTVLSGTRLFATLPRKLGALGSVPVVIQNPDGQQVSRSDLFGYHAGQILFPGPRFQVGLSPQAPAMGDFNVDGHPDLIVASGTYKSIFVLLNDGLGGFRAATEVPLFAAPKLMVAGDLNGDGRPDLALTYDIPLNVICILVGDGKGGFLAPVNVSASIDPRSLIVGDIDEDHKQDILFPAAGGYDVLSANDDGGFEITSRISTPSSTGIVLVGSSRVDLQACKLEYSIVSPK